MTASDILIIGGGIVGLATAHALCQRYPQKHITLLEKEPTLAYHQTGRNSGVLHSGIYYKPNSLKAVNCRTGKQLMEAFCEREGIPFKRVGKVIVATEERERGPMNNLLARGQANGVQCELIDRTRLLELEPHVLNGIAALHVPEAGITDYKQVCERLAEKLRANGHSIVTGAEVTAIVERPGELTAVTPRGEFRAAYLVNCAGLHSDRVTKMSAGEAPATIIPFRGEYFELKHEAWHLCNALIYPVPDPNFPFLGVHFTRMVSGGVECGPNAVLAFAREGYHLSDINAPRTVADAQLPRLPQAGRPLLEDGPGRDVALSQQARFCQRPATPHPRHSRRTPGGGAGRHPRAGPSSRRRTARRLRLS